MGFFESVGNLQQSIQLAWGGEAQREIRARKELFGVECFDRLRATSQKSRMRMFLHQIEASGAEAYMECEQDIEAMEKEKASKVDKLAGLVVDGFSRGGEAGQWLVDKLEADVADIEKRIVARKEQFGLGFFDAICFPSGNDTRRMKVNNAKGRVLQDCIASAKRDVWVMENRQQLEAEGRLAEF